MKLLLDLWKKVVRILFGGEKACRYGVSTERRSGPVENPATGGRSHSDGIRRNPIRSDWGCRFRRVPAESGGEME